MDQKIITALKNAKSPEEILALAEENQYPITEEDAKLLYKQFHQTGELSDDELDSVAGGACSTKVNGVKYTLVVNSTECFNGCFERGVDIQTVGERNKLTGFARGDRGFLRRLWVCGTDEDGEVLHTCGNCKYLEFKGIFGYCGKSGQ